MNVVAPKELSRISEQPAQPCSKELGAHPIDFDRDSDRALHASEKQFLQRQLNESAAALLLAQAKTSAVQARAAVLKDLASRDSEPQVTQVTRRDDARLLADLENTRLALQLKHREMLMKYAPTYPLVQEVEGQIADAQSAIDDARQSPIEEVTTAKTPRQEWIATELAKAQADRAGLEAGAAADHRLVKHFEQSLQRLDRPVAFERESNQDTKRACDVLDASGIEAKTVSLTALGRESRLSRMAAEKSAVGNPRLSILRWWPLSAFFMASLAALLTAYLIDFFYIRFRAAA
jgi:hypothetical protein